MKKLIPNRSVDKDILINNSDILNNSVRKDLIGQNSLLGFTIIELLTVIGILIVLTTMSIPAFRSFQKESDLTNTTEEIINILRFAQNKTLASEENSQWGVWFSTSTTPQEYILFKGENYISRDPSYDETHKIPEKIELYEINLTGGGTEVVFDKVVGSTDYFGNTSLRLKGDISKTRQVIVKNSGKILSEEETAVTEDNLIKDSRHVHFDYGRQIDTLSEVLTLTFSYNSSDVTKNIIIADNLKSGNIYWEGEVDVNGDMQRIKIHTHLLNDINLGTQFCVHRDRRYNDKALIIEISGDSGGDLVQYDENSQASQGTSVYVSTPDWQ